MKQPPNTPLGLDAAGASGDAEVLRIPVERLALDPERASKKYSKESIEALAQSIRAHGVLQPLIVRPAEGSGSQRSYWIVAGERRFRAAVLLGHAEVPCRIQREDERAETARALVVRAQQRDLSDIDKAETLRQLKSVAGLSWDRVAEMVGLSPTYARRLAGLLKLERSVRERVRRREIPARTAIALKPLPPEMQIELAEQVVRDRLTAEEVRKRARDALAGSTRTIVGRAGAAPAGPTSGPGSTPPPESLAGMPLVQIVQLLEQIRHWVVQRDRTFSSLSEEDRTEIRRYFIVVERLRQASEALLRSLPEAGHAVTAEADEEDLPTRPAG